MERNSVWRAGRRRRQRAAGQLRWRRRRRHVLVALALGIACFFDNKDAAQAAIYAGVDVNAAVFTSTGRLGGTYTAAYVAANWGSTAVLRLLLSPPVSADPDKGCISYGDTPCHAACFGNHPAAIAVLMKHGADPTPTGKCGFTACMWAANRGHKSCLRALSEGAARQEGRTLNINAVGDNVGWGWEGKTALDWAIQQNRAEAAAYLRDELGALRAKAVRRRRVCRKAIRVLLQYKLHRCVKEWLIERLAAAKVRLEFQPGGPGAQDKVPGVQN